MSIEVDTSRHVAALTAREMAVMQCVAQGKSNRQIACALGVAEHTVEKHLSNIFRKLDVTSRTQAALVYLARVAQEAYSGNPL